MAVTTKRSIAGEECCAGDGDEFRAAFDGGRSAQSAAGQQCCGDGVDLATAKTARAVTTGRAIGDVIRRKMLC